MTVKELIAKLGTLPPDAKVIYSYQSEYAELDEERIRVYTPDTINKIILRNNNYLDFYSTHWDEKEDGPPVFQTVVAFPGN